MKLLQWLNVLESDEKLNIQNVLLIVTATSSVITNDVGSCVSFAIASTLLVFKWWIAPRSEKKAQQPELDEIKEKVHRVAEQLTQTRMAIGFKAVK